MFTYLKKLFMAIWWVLKNLIFKPLKWLGVRLFMPKKFATGDAMTLVQRQAVKNLPELVAQHSKVADKMAKMATEFDSLEVEKNALEALIKAASGDFGQNKTRSNRSNNNGNNNNNNKNKGNNNQRPQQPAIATADVESLKRQSQPTPTK